MASCKDCLHVDVCKNMYIFGDMPICEHFIDRNRFVELPCNVGDTVYSIKNYHINECVVAWIRIDTRTSITIRLMTKDYIFYDVSRKDFGKTVFLTREEAEKALKNENRIME